jgi:hypothetical protein
MNNNLRNAFIGSALAALLLGGIALPASSAPAQAIDAIPAVLSTPVVETPTTVLPEPVTPTTAAPAPVVVEEVSVPAPTTTTTAAPKRKAVAKTSTTAPKVAAVDGPQPAPTEPSDPNPTRDGKDCVSTGECNPPEAAKWYRTIEGFCHEMAPSNAPKLSKEAPECATDKTVKPLPYKVIVDENGSYIEYPNGNPWGSPPAGTIILL